MESNKNDLNDEEKIIYEGYPKKCPCCEEDIIKSFHGICHICGWEDDPVQNDDPDYAGGANDESLNEYRQKFIELRKNDPKYRWRDQFK